MITIYLDSEDGNVFALLGYARRWCKQRDGNLDRYEALEGQIFECDTYQDAVDLLRTEFAELVEFR